MVMRKEIDFSESKASRKKVKCLVWDLDKTIWDGILLEGDDLKLREGIVDTIKTLDSRGILQSIASRNDYDAAFRKLEEFGISEYFLYPQINWNSKAHSIMKIAEALNIGIDSFAFVDDEAYEREEVKFTIPDVICIDAAESHKILDMPELTPKYITEDSKHRRIMYINDAKRKEVEEQFVGPQDAFLASLDMVFDISIAKETDLQRVEELTNRTNQLNTTGYTYSFEELYCLSKSKDYRLLISELNDKFGTYGKIGVALIECSPAIWTLKLLLMSCRVMSRGVGSVLLNYIIKKAKENNVILRAEFVPNDRNRMMYITLKFAGFKEIEHKDGLILLENDFSHIQEYPKFLTVNVYA